jgi:hypothetical protein
MTRCPECSRELMHAWTYCVFCGALVTGNSTAESTPPADVPRADAVEQPIEARPLEQQPIATLPPEVAEIATPSLAVAEVATLPPEEAEIATVSPPAAEIAPVPRRRAPVALIGWLVTCLGVILIAAGVVFLFTRA